MVSFRDAWRGTCPQRSGNSSVCATTGMYNAADITPRWQLFSTTRHVACSGPVCSSDQMTGPGFCGAQQSAPSLRGTQCATILVEIRTRSRRENDIPGMDFDSHRRSRYDGPRHPGLSKDGSTGGAVSATEGVVEKSCSRRQLASGRPERYPHHFHRAPQLPERCQRIFQTWPNMLSKSPTLSPMRRILADSGDILAIVGQM